jgi:hypothetical protein
MQCANVGWLEFKLKVSKSQKHFFLKLHCPKNQRNIWQNSDLASWGRILSNVLFIFGAIEFQGKLLLSFTDLYLITELTRKVMKNMSVQFEISKWNPGILVFCQFLENNLSNAQSSGELMTQIAKNKIGLEEIANQLIGLQIGYNHHDCLDFFSFQLIFSLKNSLLRAL